MDERMRQPELETPWFESQAARCYWSNSTNMVNVERKKERKKTRQKCMGKPSKST